VAARAEVDVAKTEPEPAGLPSAVRAWFGRGVRVLTPVLLVLLVAFGLFQLRQQNRSAGLRDAYLQNAARVARQAGAELDNIARRADVLIGSHRAALLLQDSGIPVWAGQDRTAMLAEGIRALESERTRRLKAGEEFGPGHGQLVDAQLAWDRAVSDFVTALDLAPGADGAARLLAAFEALGHRTGELDEVELTLARADAHQRRGSPELRNASPETAEAFEARASLLTVVALLDAREPGLLPSFVERVGSCSSDVLCELREIAKMALVALAPRTCRPDDPQVQGGMQLANGWVAVRLGEPDLCAEVKAQDSVLSPNSLPLASPGHAPEQGDFEQAWLLAQDGNVLASLAGSESHEIRKFDAWCQPDPTDLTKCMDKTDAPQRLAGSGVLAHDLGGVRYLVFYQPVMRKNPSPGAESGEGELYVATLVRASRLVAESRRIPPKAILWAALIVGLALISLPIAKLWLMGPRTPYRRSDVALLAVSATLLTLVLLTGTWSSHLQFRLRDWQGQRLERIAEQMSGAIRQELRLSAEALQLMQAETRADRRRVADWRSVLKGGDFPSPTKLISSLDDRDLVPFSPMGPVQTDPASASHYLWGVPPCQMTLWQWQETGAIEPLCEGVLDDLAENQTGGRSVPVFAWLSPRGEQLVKYTSEQYSTLPVNLAEWPPVQLALQLAAQRSPQRRMCPHEDLPVATGDGRIYCSDIERSENTGRPRLVTTSHAERGLAERGLAERDEEQWVSVLGRTPGRIFRPLLPRGIEILVIDARGKIKFETNRGNAAMGLNVLADLDDAGELEAIVRARVSGRFVAEYRGIQAQFAVQPVPQKDWYVLCVAPVGEIEHMVATICGVAMSGVSFFILGVAGLFGLAFLLSSLVPRRFRSSSFAGFFTFRPQVRLHRYYTSIGLVCLIVSVAFLIASVYIPWVRFWLVVGLVILALAVPWVPLRLVGARGFAWARPSKQTFPLEVTYSIWLFGLVSLWVGSPATVLVASAYDHVVANAVRADQTDLEERLHERKARRRGTQADGERAAMASGPTLMWGFEPMPDVATVADLDPSPFDEVLVAIAGPLGTPRRGDGYLHRAGFHRADWGKSSIPPDRYTQRRAAAIPWMLGVDWPSARFLVVYVLLSFLAWGMGVLIVRKVFFTDLLSRYRLVEDPLPEKLNNPVGPGHRLALICKDSVQFSADFRFERIERPALVARASAKKVHQATIPFLLDLTTGAPDEPEWPKVARAAGKRGLLVLLSPASLGADRDEFEHGLRQAGFSIAEAVSESPLGAPPRVIVHRPAATVRKAYEELVTGDKRPRLIRFERNMVVDGAWVGPSLSSDQGILIVDLDALLAEDGADGVIEVVLDQAVPVVAMGDEIDRYDSRQSSLSRFHEAFGPVACEAKWSRYERPTLGQLDEALGSARSDAERAVLRQVADTSFVVPHPDWRPTVEKLVARGILDPDTLLLHPRAAAYVRTHIPPPPPVDRAQSELDRTTWDAIKYPLGMAVASVLAAFGVAEPSWALTGVLGPSALAALPNLANAIFTMLTRADK